MTQKKPVFDVALVTNCSIIVSKTMDTVYFQPVLCPSISSLSVAGSILRRYF
jgi:hypothetical protein